MALSEGQYVAAVLSVICLGIFSLLWFVMTAIEPHIAPHVVRAANGQ